MQWEVLFVPLIAMAVWILGSLLRGSAEERQRGAPRGDPGERMPRRPQKSQGDLERFLEEVHRRRQGAEEPKAEAPRPAAVEPSRSKPAGPRRPPAPPVPRKPKPPPSRPSVVEVVTVQAPPPLVLPAGEAVPVAIALQGIPLATAAAAASSRAPARNVPQRALSPTLRALLQTPAAMRNAIILREILDPPLCMRRR